MNGWFNMIFDFKCKVLLNSAIVCRGTRDKYGINPSFTSERSLSHGFFQLCRDWFNFVDVIHPCGSLLCREPLSPVRDSSMPWFTFVSGTTNSNVNMLINPTYGLFGALFVYRSRVVIVRRDMRKPMMGGIWKD